MTDILGILLTACFIAILIIAGRDRYKTNRNKTVDDFNREKELRDELWNMW